MEFILKKFYELSLDELYEILQFRTEIFVMEQNCVYQDMDNLDKDSQHLYGILDKEMVCYCRIISPGKVYDQASIGRVISRKKYRGFDFGRKLMSEAVRITESQYPNAGICISAQEYLIKFYEEFGFKVYGESYLEDNIPHIKMIRN